MNERPRVAGMLWLSSIAFVVLVLGPPASPADDGAARGEAAANSGPRELPDRAGAPLRDPLASRETAAMPVQGAAPLGPGSGPAAPASPVPADGVAPLAGTLAAPDAAPSSLPTDGLTPLERGTRPPVGSATPLAPFGSGPALPPTAPTDPRTLRAVRIDLLAGPVWRSRTTDAQVLVNLEAGRLQGFSGTFHVGVVVAPDRGIVDAIDLPIGAGFVARRRLGRRSVYGSVGLTAGLLVHRAATDLGLVHRVDPDFQLPLKFAWSAGRVGFSLALLQGFSVRTRTYERRGVEVWKRIPYRIGFAVGLHFDIGVGRAKPRRARSRGL